MSVDFQAACFGEALPSALILAYSGGADSTAMLMQLVPWCESHGIALRACHVFHGLQVASQDWIALCARNCRKLGVPLDILTVELPRTPGCSVEALAREARYEVLGRHAACFSAVVVTAHHQEDQAETLLLQLLRGAGPMGLGAMQPYTPQHPESASPIWRPALGVPRAVLQQGLARSGLEWVEDPMNTDLRWARSAVRQRLWPVIRGLNPAAATTITRSAALCSDAARAQSDLAKIDLAPLRRDTSFTLTGATESLCLHGLRALPEYRLKAALRHWWAEGGFRAWPEARLIALVQQILGAGHDRQPCVSDDQGELRVWRDALWRVPRANRGSKRIAPDWLVLDIDDGPGLPRHELMASSLVLRAPVGSDIAQFHPSRPSKTVKAWAQDMGLAPWVRAKRWALYADDRLLWWEAAGVNLRHAVDTGLRFAPQIPRSNLD